MILIPQCRVKGTASTCLLITQKYMAQQGVMSHDKIPPVVIVEKAIMLL